MEVPRGVDPADAYLVLQTLVGAWPLTRERLDLYLEKALREGKQRSNWLSPDEEYERRVQEFAWSLREVAEPFVARVAPVGERIALAQTLLKLTCPGIPDIYQGDELESLVARRPGQPPAGGLERATPVSGGTAAEAACDPRGARTEGASTGGVRRHVRARRRRCGRVRVHARRRGARGGAASPRRAFRAGPEWSAVVPGLYERT